MSFFTSIIPWYDKMEKKRRQAKMSKLRDLMRKRVLLSLEMERYRREIAVSSNNQDTPMWFRVLNECQSEREVLDREIGKLLPSGSYQWDKKNGFKRSR